MALSREPRKTSTRSRRFDPENDVDMEEILKILEAPDSECDVSDDDDDSDFLEDQGATPGESDGESSSDSDIDTTERINSSGTKQAASGRNLDVTAGHCSGTLGCRPPIWKAGTFKAKDAPNFRRTDYVPPVRTPLQYLMDYFDDTFFENAAEKTAMYSHTKNGKVLNVTPARVKQLFGMHILMGCVPLPQISMYWQNGLRFEMISSVMPREEFKVLRTNLHFVDTVKPPPDAQTNKLWKVQPVVESVRNQCLRLERTSSCYSVDEQMIPFTGRTGLRQYVRGKPRPVGLKNFVITSSEGIVMDFEIYQGKTTPLADTNLGLGPNVVLRLVNSIPAGAFIYFDRYFTTIPLLGKLREMNLEGTGTIMCNRIKNCKFRNDSAYKQGDFEEYCSSDGNLVLVKWRDSKCVTLASSCTGGQPTENVQRWSKSQKQYVDVPSPAIVRSYNASMGGVDICDHLIEYYRIWIKTRKWTLKVTLHLLDLAVVNSWLCYRADCRENGMRFLSLLNFRLSIGEALVATPRKKRTPLQAEENIENAASPYRPAKVPCIDKRLDGFEHWPVADDLPSARFCRVQGCKGRTRTRCEKCNVYLCLTKERNCFKFFHTNK
ncbi:piggyBac transposable element-derived protein 3-like [Ornithodoros turicata]|uniref:piggyBac transposable element-derived protein 3-like n=1 Tax=Ornithodoros turicata TaxID=34597 RepID=UPI003139A220